MIFSIVITVLALGLMICVHELAHMLTAKRFGVLCHEFSIGMGPKLCSFGKGETKYNLRLLPIGGFVQMEGEGDESDNPRSFGKLIWWKRIIVLAAGAAVNILVGWLVFCVIAGCYGITPSVVDSVPEQYAETTVFQAGDEIMKIGGSKVHTQNDVLMAMSRLEADETDVTVKRNGKRVVLRATVRNESGERLLGVYMKHVEKPGVISALRYGAYDSIYVVKAVILSLGDLITGKQSLNALSGPVEIVSVVDDVVDAKPAEGQRDYRLNALLELFALISVNLGVFNLLPIPALDGGQILFVVIERIIGRKIKPEVVGTVNLIFFSLLMLLAVYVTFGDVMSLIGK